jgi:alkylation response protein AidB-like acyl-CoA dehydrogenase
MGEHVRKTYFCDVCMKTVPSQYELRPFVFRVHVPKTKTPSEGGGFADEGVLTAVVDADGCAYCAATLEHLLEDAVHYVRERFAEKAKVVADERLKNLGFDPKLLAPAPSEVPNDV